MNVPKDISTLYRKMQAFLNIQLEPIGLSSGKAMFLFCLYDHEFLTQSEICKKLDMDKSTVAKMLIRLENEGYITKEVSSKDIRSFAVRLTDHARSLVPKARKVHDDWVVEITSDLTDLEKGIFFELLTKAANSSKKLCD